MDRKIRILIVEDDMIIAANISLQLTNLGYQITGMVSRGEEAFRHIKENAVDIILLDINLKGSLNGIDTAKAIQKIRNIPIIYLTANSDNATFNEAKETQPRAFITKPFNKLRLQRTVALVAEQLKENVSKNTVRGTPELEVLTDRIFVRHHGKMEKLLLDDIQYIEADRNYCTIVTSVGKHVLATTLKSMEEKLPKSSFTRVHRSYIVNIAKLDVVADHHLEIKRVVIPLSKTHKEALLGRIQMI